MPRTRLVPAAALLLSGAAALPAQTTVRRDTTVARGDTVIREYRISRLGPGGGPGDLGGAFGDLAALVDGRRALAARSIIGVYVGQADEAGLRVAQVTPDGPAARAGITVGDRLTSVAGVSLRLDRADAGDPLLAAVPGRRLERTVGRLAPGSEVELRVIREGRERTVRLRTVAPSAVADRGGYTVREYRTLPGRAEVFVPGPGFGPGPDGVFRERVPERLRGSFSDSTFFRARVRGDSVRARAAARPVLGLTLDGAGGGGRDTLGIFVSAVARGGPAERAGIVEGDRIAGVNGVDLRVPRDEQGDPRAADARRARFTRELGRLRPGDRVTLRVWGDGRWRTVTATVGRSADVYPATNAFGVDWGDGVGPALAPAFPGGVGMVRGLRAAPMPNAVGPRLRGFVVPGPAMAPMRSMAPMRPVPPLPPMVPLTPRVGRRLVRI